MLLSFRDTFAEHALDVIVHGGDIGLVDDHALAGQVAGVVDGDALVLRVAGPVVVEDEEQFLCSSQREDGQQCSAPSVQDTRDRLHESVFSFLAGDVGGDAVGALGDEDVYVSVLRDRCGDEVAVVFAGEIAREEDLQACDLDQIHGCTEDMAGWIGSETDGGDGVCGMVVYCFNLWEGSEMVGFSVERCSLVRR